MNYHSADDYEAAQDYQVIYYEIQGKAMRIVDIEERRRYLFDELQRWTREVDPDLESGGHPDTADVFRFDGEPLPFSVQAHVHAMKRNPEYHDFVKRLRELRDEQFTKIEYARVPDRIRWKGTQDELLALFELLSDADLVDFIDDDGNWNLQHCIVDHFEQKSAKPFSADQLRRRKAPSGEYGQNGNKYRDDLVGMLDKALDKLSKTDE